MLLEKCYEAFNDKDHKNILAVIFYALNFSM